MLKASHCNPHINSHANTDLPILIYFSDMEGVKWTYVDIIKRLAEASHPSWHHV